MNEILADYIRLSKNGPSEYLQLIKLSKTLLLSLPSSRENVFDNLQSIFAFILTKYLQNHKDNDLENLLEEIKNLIISFTHVSTNWRNFIFIWSLKLLANISQDYSNQIKPYSLETSFNYWTSNAPAITIMSILSHCINQSSTEECICNSSKFLLYNFSIHSEWLVAYIGFAFPNEILETALTIGLKEFINSNEMIIDKNSDKTGQNISLNCIIKIVDYLASQHNFVLNQNILKILKLGMDEKIKIYIPKYFIHLSLQSDRIYFAIAAVFLDHADYCLINSYIEDISKNQNVFNQYANSLHQIVKLLINSNSNSYKVLMKIILSSDSDIKKNKIFKQVCIQIMNNLIMEMHHHFGMDQKINIPLLKNVANDFENVCEEVIQSGSFQKQSWLLQLLVMAGKVADLDLGSNIFFQLFLFCNHPNQMSPLLNYYSNVCDSNNYIIVNFVDKLFENIGNTDLTLTFNKLLVLQKQEDSVTNKLISTDIKLALLNHLNIICSHLFSADLQQQKLILKLLNNLEFSLYSNFSDILSISLILIDYYFSLLKRNIDSAVILNLCVSCMQLIEKLSTITLPIQNAIVCSLIENSILKPEKKTISKNKFVNLIEENKSFSNMISSSIIFHSGTLSNAQKPKLAKDDNDLLNPAHQLVVSLIWSCASSNQSAGTKQNITFDLNKPTAEMTKLMCSTLVELVSPDLMYTGPQWPVEEFIKVTIERDLHVRNRFNDNPILWHLLDLISIMPNGLMQCSCLIRSILATLINYWEVSRSARASDSPTHLMHTYRLFEILNKAQLLPEPLCYTSCLLSSVTPYEAFLLLLNIWRYMKIIMNGTLQKPAITMSTFTDVIHLVIQNNISQLGHLYTLFFKL